MDLYFVEIKRNTIDSVTEVLLLQDTKIITKEPVFGALRFTGVYF